MVALKKADIEMGIVGALFIAVPIYFINLPGGVRAALIASLAQLAYSFSIISTNMSICRNLCKKSAILSTLAPTLLTTTLTYAIHAIIKSPEPFWSAMYAFSTALPSFALFTYRYKKTDKPIIELVKNGLKNGFKKKHYQKNN